VICREPIENVQMHILIVPALFGALVAVADGLAVLPFAVIK